MKRLIFTILVGCSLVSCTTKIEQNTEEMNDRMGKLEDQFRQLNQFMAQLAAVGISFQDFVVAMLEASAGNEDNPDSIDEDDLNEIPDDLDFDE